METIVKALMTSAPVDVNEDSRIIKFLGTLETMDRMGDIIEVNGWELDNFTKNPVFLWDHNPSVPPIGKVVRVDKEANGLLFHVQFAPADVNEFADRIFKMYKSGFLSAVSVGFIPKSVEFIRNSKDEITGMRIKRQELLELSAVSIPAHQDALAASALSKAAKEYTSGKSTESEYVNFVEYVKKELHTELLTPNEDEAEMDELKKQVEELKAQVEALTKQVEGMTTLKDMIDLSQKSMDTLSKTLVVMATKKSGGEETAKPVDLSSALDKLMSQVKTRETFTPAK